MPMKKIYLFLLCLFTASMALLAGPVDEESAKNIAANFTNSSSRLRSPANPESAVLTTAYISSRTDGLNRFYVFNRGKSNGFVIVSGDDRAEAVLGYTDNGSFDINNIPPNMKWWLNEYANQMDALYNGEYGDMSFLPSELTPSYTSLDEVAPLLRDIKWGQGEPYNNMCPIHEGENSVTGCVATAMAQIMRYHKHPQQGKGSHTYYWSEGRQELTVNFDGVNYDWDNMLPLYGVSADDFDGHKPERWWPEEWLPEGWQANTQAEKDAVATLMYHCGVSVEMKYTSGESGASSMNVPVALYNYFGYDGGMAYRHRDGYSTDEWEELVRSELDAGRPLYYAGVTPSGGAHAFVCDGYDTNGFFHINWGWNGISDGYYLLSALSPGEQGTGGYEGGYNLRQGILTGIQPDKDGVPDNGAQILSTGLIPVDDVVTKGNSLVFESEWLRSENWISDAVRFNLGLLFYNGLGELVASVPMNSGYLELERNYYYDFTSQNMFFNFPEDLADGEYKLVLAFSDYGDGSGYNWQHVKVPQNLQPVMARIEGDNIYLSGGAKPDDENFNQAWKLDGLYSESVVPDEISQYKNFSVTASLQNTGKYGFKGSVSLCYMDTDGNTLFYSKPVTCEIPSGEKQTVNIVDNVGNKLQAGKYQLSMVYNVESSVSSPLEVTFDNGKQYFDIEVIQGEVPELRLLAASTEVPDTVFVEQNDFTAKICIENIGNNDFSGEVAVELENERGGSVYTFKVLAELLSGQTATIDVPCEISGLSLGKYNWRCYMINGNLSKQIDRDTETECSLVVLHKIYVSETMTPLIDMNYIRIPQDGNFQIIVKLKNEGIETYEKELAVVILDDHSENMLCMMLSDGPVSVAPGATTRIRFNGNLEGKWPSGQCGINLIALEEGHFGNYIYQGNGSRSVLSWVGDSPTVPTLIIDQDECEYVEECSAGNEYEMTLVVLNHGTDFDGEVYATLQNGSTVINRQTIPVKIKQGEEAFIPYKWKLPENVEPGKYQFVYEAKYPKNPNLIYKIWGQLDRFITVTASTPEPTEPELKVVQGETTSLTEFVKTTDYDMELTLQNDGTDFKGDVYVVLWDGEASLYHEQAVSMTIPKGQKIKADYTWNVPSSVPAGQYLLSYALIADGYYHFISIDEYGTAGIYVEVKENTDGPILSLVSSKTTVPSVVYQNTDFTARTVLQNTGGADFKGEVCLLVLTTDGNVKYNTKPFLQVDVPAKGSVPLNIEGNVGNLALGNYYVAFATVKDLTPTLLYYDTGGNVTELEIKKALTDLPDDEVSDGLRIYYSTPVQDFVTIRSNERPEFIGVFTLTGTKVMEVNNPATNEYQVDMSDLNPGTYLLVVQTKTSKRTVKLLKR